MLPVVETTRLHRVVDFVCARRACAVFAIRTRSEKHQNAHIFGASRKMITTRKIGREGSRDIHSFISPTIEFPPTKFICQKSNDQCINVTPEINLN